MSVLCALVCGILILRRRWVWRLGPMGPALAPAFLVIVWLLFLSLGQAFGSLEAMGWTAAAPLIALAFHAARTSRPRRLNPCRWTGLDLGVTLAAVALLFAFVGHDLPGHYAMIGAYLRGNIPPTAFNDPGAPLRYHLLFDMASALLARALGVSPQTAMALASAGCVFASMACLQALSRVLFGEPRAQQAARVLFLFGFGPVYLRLLLGAEQLAPHHLLHGQTTQSFLEAVLRRPMSLNFMLFLFVLSCALPRLRSRVDGALRPSAAPHPLWLLPCALAIPQASEELALFCALIILWLGFARALPWRWVFLGAGAMLLGFGQSGVLRGLFDSQGGNALPQVGLSWPPRLPHSDFWRDGTPLFSRPGAWSLCVEWGPLFLGGLYLGRREPRRRVIAAIALLGLILACGLSLKSWDHADLDRLLFYGTAAGFLLAAAWVEALPHRPAAALALVLSMVLGPLGYAGFHVARRGFGLTSNVLPAPMPPELAVFLAPVGPRDLVLTDAPHAQWLLGFGFLVAAPMKGSMIGAVEPFEPQAYLESRPKPAPAWLFLPSRHPLLAGRAPTARYEDYVLARF